MNELESAVEEESGVQVGESGKEESVLGEEEEGAEEPEPLPAWMRYLPKKRLKPEGIPGDQGTRFVRPVPSLNRFGPTGSMALSEGKRKREQPEKEIASTELVIAADISSPPSRRKLKRHNVAETSLLMEMFSISK